MKRVIGYLLLVTCEVASSSSMITPLATTTEVRFEGGRVLLSCDLRCELVAASGAREIRIDVSELEIQGQILPGTLNVYSSQAGFDIDYFSIRVERFCESKSDQMCFLDFAVRRGKLDGVVSILNYKLNRESSGMINVEELTGGIK